MCQCCAFANVLYNPSMNKILAVNAATWDKVAPAHFGSTHLPAWGPFQVGSKDPTILGDIQGKTFLELGCGSGHSIQYLIQQGAKKVYGLDLSEVQVATARELNQQAVAQGKVELFHQPMEEKIELEESVDTVYSVYAVGWTYDPKLLFTHVYSYLKPGGRFVWSWDSTLFAHSKVVNGEVVVTEPYHGLTHRYDPNWKGHGSPVHITYRKTSVWSEYLFRAEFRIMRLLEPSPEVVPEHLKDPCRYYYIGKALMVPATIIYVCEKI